MSISEFDVRIDGERVLIDLGSLLSTLNVERVLDEAGALLLNRNRTRFLGEVDPDNKPWEPSFAGLRRRAKGGTGTLFDTGNLFRSIQLSATGPDERTISTDVSYAAKHQFGLEGMVERQFLGVNEEDATLVETLLLKRIDEVVK